MCDVRLVMNLHFLFLWYIHKILVKYMKGEKKKKWSSILFITEMVKLAYADINDKIHYVLHIPMNIQRKVLDQSHKFGLVFRISPTLSCVRNTNDLVIDRYY